MKRRQKPLIHLALFIIVLLIILYLGHSGSSTRTFAWRTVRYNSQALSLPPTRGICPGLTSKRPALVIARVGADGDPGWLDTLSNRYHLCIYTADAPMNEASMNLQVPANRGHEAMAYLTFIIGNYDNIPEAGAVFVHGSRFSWHNDDPHYDNLALLGALNISAALALTGYHNLRCDWSASTCDRASSPAQGSLENSFRAVLQPYDPRVVSDSALPRSLAILFDNDGQVGDKILPGRGDAIRSQCCAQFVVSRESIWQHSRDEYVALRQWLLDGEATSSGAQKSLNKNAAPLDDRVAGRILSYIWHILFINKRGPSDGLVDLQQLNQLACPSAEECYCRLYGRCDLPGCKTPGRCNGQYQIPPDFKLPPGWADSHS